ncbi:Mannan endo-1 [Diplonema papillatum]|nr:Mannan endo-1 [Diplonema papillatum]|eukprot:gene23178-35519_t
MRTRGLLALCTLAVFASSANAQQCQYAGCASSADCCDGYICYELLSGEQPGMCMVSGACSAAWSCRVLNPQTPAPSPAHAADAIPNAANNDMPYCRSGEADPDGDGWGWENGASCVVYASSVDPGVGSYAYCLVGSDKLTLCATDTGSWSSESGAVCLSKTMCPGMGSAQSAMRSSLVNPAATAAAKDVYGYLKSQWGKKIIAGQMDLTWQDNIDQYQRCIDDTGKAPALMGYDFLMYGESWNGISGIQQTEEALAHADRGGLVTFTWHWRDPSSPAGVVGEFYTEKTDFQIPIANGVIDTSSTAYADIMKDIELISDELKTLQDAGVPVLWRPLHEAAGGWFWWGAKRTDGVPPGFACVLLWKLLYTTMTVTHGLNNLIWVWNGQNAAWYPGDDYVDIVSYDIYAPARTYDSQIDLYKETATYPHEVKIVALSENSNIPDPDECQKDGAWWSWFMVWNDVDTAAGVSSDSNFWTGEFYNTNAHKKHVYTHDLVVTLDELPSF